MIKAVITGDIVQSGKLSNEQKITLFTSLSDYLKKLKKSHRMKSELFRGDSFQCLTDNPADSLRLALLIKTYIRSLNPTELHEVTNKATGKKKVETWIPTWVVDARMAIGIGKVELENRTLANSDGEAFYRSGILLDEIKSSKQHLAIDSSDKYSKEWATESILLDAIIRKTTALQCEVINYKLDYWTETEIANKLNLSQSAVNQRSNGGDWLAIETMVNRFETAYKK